MNMSVTAGNQPYLSGTAMTGSQPATTNDPTTDAVGAQAAATAEAGGLTDVQMQELYTQLVQTNADLMALSDENGATAISLPSVASSTDMGALSTADLIQLIRAEVAKTTALLTAATAEAITAQQATIELKGQENTGKIQESIQKEKEAAEKAEKMKALSTIMKIFGGIATALGVLVAVATGGTAAVVIAVALAAMYVTMTCMTEIQNENGETGMDLMGKSCAKSFYSHLPPEEAEKKGAAAAGFIMMGIQLALCVASLANGALAAYKAFTAVTTSVATGGAAGASAGTTAATTAAAEAAKTATLETTKAVAKTIANLGKQLSTMVQGGLQVASGVQALDVANSSYDASMAQAAVTELKAMIKMLEQILETDSAFLQMLMELLAKVDSFTADVVADEHASNQQTDLHSGAMA